MGEKVTVMVLKVNLQCSSNYEKIKKILCKIPQIRNQIFDDEQNTVTISVVCCSPKKIRDKLCCKGRKVIESIEIKEPKKIPEQKPESPKKPKEEVIEVPKSPKKPELPKHPPPPPTRTCCGPCLEGYSGGPCYHGYPYPQSCYSSCYGYWRRCGCGCGCGHRGECGCGCGCGRGYGRVCGCGRGCLMGMCVCVI